MGSRPSSPSLPILTLRKSAIEHISVGERSDAHTFASHLREEYWAARCPVIRARNGYISDAGRRGAPPVIGGLDWNIPHKSNCSLVLPRTKSGHNAERGRTQ